MEMEISLRPLQINDFDDVLKWSKDDGFCMANGWEKNRDRDELYQWWQKCVNNKAHNFIRLGIEFEGKLIGYADLACIKGNSAEIGIAIGNRSLWGNGIGSASLLRVIDYAANTLGIDIFTAETHEGNVRSRKMLEKTGFIERSKIGNEIYMGQANQLIQYELIRY
ncbi:MULTISPECIES: GNAT family N-acetyltransferase [Sporosarcina]|uniref:GNAT family N-acetyltransferase n=1 Tax=Sporosarcina contaminans TaxID=633403 RepID=A0ABW3TTY9_9BACL